MTSSLSVDRLLRFAIRAYPLLVLGLAAQHVVSHASPRLFGDEWRYLWYARHLTHGYFSPRDNPVLLNGPGYPLLLVPFVATGAPTLLPKLLNALLFVAAIVYVQRTLALYLSPVGAALGGLACALWPLPWRYLHLVYTETFALCLVCGLFFHFCRAVRGPKTTLHTLLAAALFGALVMTKVSFAGPLMLSLVLAAIAWRWRRSRPLGVASVVCGLALLSCVPWLVYTYRVSGHLLYWTSGIGQQAYWISTPFPEERGDWFHQGWVHDQPMLHAHHAADYARLTGDPAATAGTELDRVMPGIGKLWGVEADAAFLRLAIEQVAHHPLAYARNWLFNVVRLFFDFPYTFPRPFDWRVIVPHALLLGLVGWVCVKWRRAELVIPNELALVAGFTFITCLLSTLLSAHVRFFVPFFPGLLLLGAVGVSQITRAASPHDAEPAGPPRAA